MTTICLPSILQLVHCAGRYGNFQLGIGMKPGIPVLRYHNLHGKMQWKVHYTCSRTLQTIFISKTHLKMR